MPGAMAQAAVNVPVTQTAQTATPKDGGGYGLSIDFGKIVPGKYTLTAMVVSGSPAEATIAGQAAIITGNVISATIDLTKETEVKLEVSGADGFTIGTYLLKLEWDLDKTAWNGLINNVSNKVGETFNGKLTEDNKVSLLAQLAAKKEGIEELANEYDTYKNNELWKLGTGDDKISTGIKAIQTAAEEQVIEDCWATKEAAYDTAVANVPTEERLSDLQNDINDLQINKDKRQESYNYIYGQVEGFKAAALEAKGSKAETWEKAIADEYEFDFKPDPTLDEINSALEELEGFVATDHANYERYTEMSKRVTEAQTAINDVDTDETLNNTDKGANANTKADIVSSLEEYANDAKTDYNTTIKNDGDEFDFDPDYTNLANIEANTTSLSEKIESDNEAYNTAATTIQGYFTDATNHYNEKMTELSNAITDPAENIVSILEKAQSDLLKQKTALSELENNKYTADGRDLDPDVALADIQTIEDEMDAIVEQAITDAQVAANHNAFKAYQAEQMAAATNLAKEGDSNACAALIANANADIDALKYDDEKTLDENKAAVDDIIDTLNTQLNEQRAADLLAANMADFDNYKGQQKTAAENLAEEGDSSACEALIEEAKDAINDLTYDEDKTLEKNKEAVNEIVNNLAAELNNTRFNEYKTKVIADNFTADDGDTDKSATIITNATNEINSLAYDEEKDLGANKAAVDEIVSKYKPLLEQQRAVDNAEAAAGELVDYMYDLVSSQQKELADSVEKSKEAYTGKMGKDESEIQERYTSLESAIADIKTECDEIKNTELGKEDVFEPDPEDPEKQIKTTNYANTNVKKVNAYNELLDKIGKSNGKGLYGQYTKLDGDAKKAKDAKDANDNKYTELTSQIAELQASFSDAQTDIDALSDWAQSEVAEDEVRIQGLIDDATTALNNANGNQELTTDSKLSDYETINTAIANLSTTATQKENQWQTNETKYAELAKEFEVDADDEFTSLQETYNAAKIKVDALIVADDFAETLTKIQNDIDEAKAALDAAYDEVTLTATSTIENKATIEDAINKVVKDATAKNKKVEANANLMAKYNEVNIDLAEQRSLAVEAAGTGAANYYRGLFNNENGYVDQLAKIKKLIEDNYNDETLDASVYENDLSGQLDALKEKIDGVVALATANKAAYDAQIDAYDYAVETYNTNYENLTNPANYVQDAVTESVEALEEFSPETGELKSALETIENDYATGVAGDQQVVNNNTISDIVAGIKAIIETVNGDGDNSYYQYIVSVNDSTKSLVDEEIAKIQPAYVAAVNVLNEYTGAQDEDLNSVITEAATDLNNAVFNTVQKRTQFNTEATEALNANNTAKTVWDADELIQNIQNYVQGLNTTKDNFVDGITGEIVRYWEEVKADREQTISDTYEALNENGYINGEGANEIFEAADGYIASGDKIVYEVDEETGELTNTPKNLISISALDDLVFNGNLNADNFESTVKIVATDFAKNFVDDKLAEYKNTEDGKIAEDWAEIKGIFGEHDVDYGKPETAEGAKEQFNDIVAETVKEAEDTDVTYETDYNYIQDLLNQYDSSVDELKTTVQGWVESQEAADANLANAQGELEAAQEELLEAVSEAQSQFDTLKGKVNKTRVADNYTDAFAEIQAKIKTASSVATADMPETLNEVQEAAGNVETQMEIINGITTGAGQGTLTYVETTATSNLKNDLAQLIPDLKVQFNAYAASSDPDQTKVDDWNTRIQNAITKTGAGYMPTLDEMIEIEQDIYKLQTELGDISGDMAGTIEKFKERLQTLANAALPEADYGSKNDTFAETLSDIKTEAEMISSEVTQHETDGDIAPYVDNIESRIKTQETAWTNLQANASAQADKVEYAKNLANELNNRVENLTSTTLDGEYSPTDKNYIIDSLSEINSEAERIAGEIEEYGEDIAAHETDITSELENLELQLNDLMEYAADAATSWAKQMATSNNVYEQLESIISDVETTISEAKTAIEGYEYDTTNDLVQIENQEETFNEYKTSIEEKKDYYRLNNSDVSDNVNSYKSCLNGVKSQVLNTMNAAAKKQAQVLYTGEGSEVGAAKKAANDALNGWTYSSTVKAAMRAEIEEIDNEVGELATTINNEKKTYENGKLSEYAETAAQIIAKYQAKVTDIKDYEENYVFGDANGDKKVNVLDYQKVQNMILDPSIQPAETDKLFANIDINQNEVIEVGDLAAIVNKILDKDYEWDGYTNVKAFGRANEGLTMTTSATQVGTQRIALNLQNSEDYTAFQLDVVLPEGMTIVGQSLSDRAGQSHKLYSRAQQDGSIRFLASSIKGETFSGGEGAVLYIDVQTDASFQGGSVEMLNILFSDVYANTHAFAIGNGDEATGIDIMAAMQSLKQKVYDLGGRVMNGMKKGVNIIQNADGTTKKVLK